MLLPDKLQKRPKRQKQQRQNAAANGVSEMNTLAFLAQQGLLEGLDRVVHFESLPQCRRPYVTNAVVPQAAERIINAKAPSKRCCKQRFGVYTLAFSVQQGLLEELDRVVHFEPLAQCRRSYVTNFVVAQAAGKAGNATTPSKRCCKQCIGVNALAFFAQEGLL